METAVTRRSDMQPSDAVGDVRHETARATIVAEPAGIPARFKILSELGYGGMGIVYKVRDVETDEIVALKLLKPEIAADPRMREELRQEVCLARKVTHKNVCRIHELYRSPASSFISMEFVSGETLLSKLGRGGALSVVESIGIVRQICAGLREAHAHGIVHRDLKPANIMIDASGVVKIMDFGIARHSQENNHFTTTITGTPEYMAPEQIELKAMGPRTDIYALGLLLYEMVTGTQAFTGGTAIAVAVKQLHDAPKRPSEIVPSIPPGLQAVILKCLRKNSESRFLSVDELDRALCQPAATSATAPRTVALPAISVDVNAVVRSASDKWQIVQPHLVRYVAEGGRLARQARLLAHIECKKLVLRFVATTPGAVRKNRLVQIGAVVGVAMLAVALFVMVAGKFSKHAPAPSQAAVPPADQDVRGAIAAPVPAPSSADVPVASESVVPAANADDTVVADVGTADPASGDSSADAKPPASSPAGSPGPSEAPGPDAAKKQASLAIRPTSLRPKSKPSVAVKKSADVSATAMHAAAEVQTTSLVTAPTLAPAPAVLLPAASPAASTATAPPSVRDTVSETYLEVGSFKEAKWADDAVQQLSQLGYHAICVHKTMLWKLQSFHVEVGPFTTSSEVDDAEKKLIAQGFKPHIVK
jgi:cell division protein FtsN